VTEDIAGTEKSLYGNSLEFTPVCVKKEKAALFKVELKIQGNYCTYKTSISSLEMKSI